MADFLSNLYLYAVAFIDIKFLTAIIEQNMISQILLLGDQLEPEEREFLELKASDPLYKNPEFESKYTPYFWSKILTIMRFMFIFKFYNLSRFIRVFRMIQERFDSLVIDQTLNESIKLWIQFIIIVFRICFCINLGACGWMMFSKQIEEETH